MNLTRTTVRIEPSLKKAVDLLALTNGISFQSIFDQALKEYVQKNHVKKAKKIVFLGQDLGVPLDELTREDIYAD